MEEVYSHLSEEERRVIRIEIGSGAIIYGIVPMLGRNASTAGREIKRDMWFPSNENKPYRPYRPKRLETGPWTGRYYIAGLVQRKAGRRRAEPRRRHRLPCERLWTRAAEWLGRGWSLLPVSGRLRALFPDDFVMRVYPETVCYRIHADRHRRERWACRLPRGHGRCRRRGGGRTSRLPIPGRAPIFKCPSEAGDRSGFDHWEADGVIGAGCNLHTGVEGKTRFLMAGIVLDRTVGESVGAQLAIFSPLPAGARGGVTHDNGTEFAHHERLRDGSDMDMRFADPCPSRRRGNNKNRNGMIRRYLSKRSEVRMDMAGELWEIVDEADNRPMRVLNYRTLAEASVDELL